MWSATGRRSSEAQAPFVGVSDGCPSMGPYLALKDLYYTSKGSEIWATCLYLVVKKVLALPWQALPSLARTSNCRCAQRIWSALGQICPFQRRIDGPVKGPFKGSSDWRLQ